MNTEAKARHGTAGTSSTRRRGIAFDIDVFTWERQS